MGVLYIAEMLYFFFRNKPDLQNGGDGKRERERERDYCIHPSSLNISISQTHPAVRSARELLTKRTTCPQVCRKCEERARVITRSYLYRPYLLITQQMVQAPRLPLGPAERGVPKDGAAIHQPPSLQGSGLVRIAVDKSPDAEKSSPTKRQSSESLISNPAR